MYLRNDEIIWDMSGIKSYLTSWVWPTDISCTCVQSRQVSLLYLLSLVSSAQQRRSVRAQDVPTRTTLPHSVSCCDGGKTSEMNSSWPSVLSCHARLRCGVWSSSWPSTLCDVRLVRESWGKISQHQLVIHVIHNHSFRLFTISESGWDPVNITDLADHTWWRKREALDE